MQTKSYTNKKSGEGWVVGWVYDLLMWKGMLKKKYIMPKRDSICMYNCVIHLCYT